MRVSERFGTSRHSSDLPAMISHCRHSSLIRPYRFFAVSLILTVCLQTASQAQDLRDVPNPSDTLYVVELDNGSQIIGRIAEVDDEKVVVTLQGGGQAEFTRAQISEVRLATKWRVVRGKLWARDPGNTRLFFTSTGRALRAGEGYVGTYLVVLPFVSIGATDFLTFTAGAPILLGQLQPFYAGPKVRILRTADLQASVGTLAFFYDDIVFGVVYGVGTVGSLDRAVTAGTGVLYSGSGFAKEPVFMLGGEWRVSSSVKFISENYFVSTGSVFAFGLRRISRWGSTELGVGGYGSGNGIGCCLPLLNISFAFGR